MSSVGNHRQIDLTQVTPSTQEVIKAGFHSDHLRSSTIAGCYAGVNSQHCPKALLQILFDQASTLARSIETPGPIVDEMVSFFKNMPLAAAGFAFVRSTSNAARFSLSAGTSKSERPIGQ